MNIFPVLRWVIRINQDVVEIDHSANIKHITKNIIHEMLKNHGAIGKTERHDFVGCTHASEPISIQTYS
jgi:hypothetical protein